MADPVRSDRNGLSGEGAETGPVRIPGGAPGSRAPGADDAVVWSPPNGGRGSRLARFAEEVATTHGAPLVDVSTVDGYAELHAWSVAEPGAFWVAVWEACGVVGDGPGPPGDGLDLMRPPAPEGPRWFPDARLSFAENLLRFDGDRVAIRGWTERGAYLTLTHRELRAEVARIASGLRELGVRPGDRVAASLPNVPEAVVAMLATASIGAVWSSCSPDFGTGATLDRFAQIAPTVLFAADGYVYGGKVIDTRERVREIAAGLPGVRAVVRVAHLARAVGPADQEAHAEQEEEREEARWNEDGAARVVRWERFGDPAATVPDLPRFPFDHPLYVVYSSGTTGLPKAIVHGAGGTLLQHLKELVLHTDVGPDDTVSYHTTCGWMMWNWIVSALATGATLVVRDGSPTAPGPDALWEFAARERLTVLGTSARHLALSEKEGVSPARTHRLDALRTILSTGSPLAPRSFDYVYREVKPDVHLASISGGTDLLSCFVLGVPTLPVRRGEVQGAGLGMAVEILDERGTPQHGDPGELVCTRPFPSMPIGFWGDEEGRRYHATYFEHFPGVWHHGDWAERTPSGGFVIHGRSDATLNPGGVRIGTAEIHRQVEAVPEVVEALAVGQEYEGDVRIVLLVRLRDGGALDDALRERIRARIRANASPHHVPKVIARVDDLPRTISGKISEIAAREALHGRLVANTSALANPESLDAIRALPELAHEGSGGR